VKTECIECTFNEKKERKDSKGTSKSSNWLCCNIEAERLRYLDTIALDGVGISMRTFFMK